ncbi:hypothetical protein [Nitratidesulfovibrio sp. 1201_IL3209]|uniref:hypothetical protein n=1 Tax=Nitratidesulfovibrio sp. 1201_IL3209 TaxID=3084053 RepID=UPI002FDAD5A6
MTTTGQDAAGQDATGQDVTGQDAKGQGSGGLPATGRLVDSHPLLARLTGQVVWNLAEEAGADDGECSLFMDHYVAWRGAALGVLERLRDAPGGGLRLVVDDEDRAGACPECVALHGVVLPGTHPDLAAWLPPFSIGCHCRAEYVEATEMAVAGPHLPPGLRPPAHRLCCPRRPLSLLLAQLQGHEG